ncbi:thyroid adenoma-associated protein homolog [Mya arenaria]|uniref:thyroid adenoma-associated protein homolog n=1 Tax=Mya arenaria TaxID=6604 RepID=UPI0022E5FD0D|nr:thyroid adenoma-associated protein homolog [Mya arenaria]
MPALQTTKELFIPAKFKRINETFNQGVEQDDTFNLLRSLTNADNAKHLVDSFKKVSKCIQKRLSNEGLESVHRHIEYLVQLFFVCTTKNPLRRVLISFFQSLPKDVSVQTVQPAIIEHLTDLYTGAQNVQGLGNDEMLDVRHDIDSIAAITENFPLGITSVSIVNVETVEYLSKLNLLFIKATSQSPVQQNEVMHHCLVAVKLTNRICQKTASTLKTRLQDAESMLHFQLIARQCILCDIEVLYKVEFLVDCKTTSAMNICLMLKCCSPEIDILHLLSKTAFGHLTWVHELVPSPSSPLSWAANLPLDRLSKTCLSPSSYLCFCYGMLTMAAMETLLGQAGGKVFLLHGLLPEFLELGECCSDVGSKLLAAKSVCFLTQRIRDNLAMTTATDDVWGHFHGDSVAMQTILQFVFTAWEDAIDAVRFTVRDIFQNVLAIHIYFLNRKGLSIMDDPFLHKLTCTILHDVPWSCKGKYGTLAALVGHLGSARMLQWQSGIAAAILQQLQEHTLACYASELYEKLFLSHMFEILVADQADTAKQTWFSEWVEPVIRVLCGPTTLQKKHTIEYVLPRLLKCGENVLADMVHWLSGRLTEKQSNIESGNVIGALILCLRRARAMGQLKSGSKRKSLLEENSHQTAKPAKPSKEGSKKKTSLKETEECSTSDMENISQQSKDLWLGIVDVGLLEHALVCKDEQVRLDAFALLCENQKTAEPVENCEILLVKRFIPSNLNNQNSAFRQQFTALIKKLLLRMKESSGPLRKQMSKTPAVKHHLQNYMDFLQWLRGCMLDSLYPGAVFAQKTTCLTTLALLHAIFGSLEKGNEAGCGFSFFPGLRMTDIHTLLFCLTDTFEDNKHEAARILKTLATHSETQCLMTADILQEVFDLALTLSQSARPQDSTTGAYLFSVLTQQPRARDILLQYIHPSGGGNDGGSLTGDTGTAHISQVTGAVYEKHDLNEVKESLAKEYNVRGSGDSEVSQSYLLLRILLSSLESQYRTAKTSLIVAAATSPLYPTLMCMRYCFNNIHFRTIPDEYLSAWRQLLKKFISLYMQISAIVSPVVCNSSPEGNVPTESLTDLSSLGIMDADSVARSHETVMLMPEYLTVCCWRTVKEISLILGQLTSALPLQDDDGELLNFEQVLEIGKYFTSLLLESKHRGAFELAYAGFVKVTEVLWRSPSLILLSLPSKWLGEVMSDIRSHDSRLCATRRSAGVPFYVQALVTTEPSSTGRQCFRQTVQELLGLALDQSAVTMDTCTGKVHALNILRALYKDSRLKDDVAPFIADGLRVAILGFKSPLWAVRNSATLLMTAMMTRVFGVKRSKDESTFSRKNCQTGRTFFYNYPILYQFLLGEIAMATEDIAHRLHPGLFPVLMVLGRLFPSAMEGTDTSLNLPAFIPYVIKCSASPVMKTREMAAKALQPLVDKDHVTTVFSDLMTLLPCQPGEHLKQNQIHGALLQLKQMFRTILDLPVSAKVSLDGVLGVMWPVRASLLASRLNPCLLTRKETLEVSSLVAKHFSDDVTLSKILEDLIHQEMTLAVGTGGERVGYDSSSPALWQFETTVCRLYFQHYIRNEVAYTCKSPGEWDRIEQHLIAFLMSTFYEVRKEVLENLCDMDSIVVRKDESHEKLSDVNSDCSAETLVRKDKGLMENCDRCRSLLHSKELYLTVMELVDSEHNEECLELALRLLSNLPTKDQISQEELINALERITARVQTKKNSDKVVAAMVGFSGSLLHSILSSCPPKSSPKMGPVLQWWGSMMHGLTSHMETDSDILLACARALNQNFSTLVHINSPVRCLMFRSALDLLQADDLEVRETTAAIADCLSSEQLPVELHPYRAMVVMVDVWLAVSEGSVQGLLDTVHSILDIVCQSKAETQESEERLFDRGEINTYWDELDLLKVIFPALTWGVSKLQEQIKVDNKSRDSILQPVVTRILQYICENSELSQSTSSTSLQAMFTAGHEYQTLITDMYRVVIVARVGLALEGSRDLGDQCEAMLEGLRKCPNVERLPSIVCKLLCQ